jgi:excinuclease ABC subunit B
MQLSIDETARRRSIQLKYNEDHNITPQQITKKIGSSLAMGKDSDSQNTIRGNNTTNVYIEPEIGAFAADPIVRCMSRKELQKSIDNTTELMKMAAKNLDFIQAAQYRDEIVRLQDQLKLKE